MPRLEAGRALAPMVSAMMDVSDGLLIDAWRMAVASGAAMRIDLDAVPLSPEYAAVRGVGLDARLAAATARSEEHTSELQSLMRISYDVFCLKKKNTSVTIHIFHSHSTTHTSPLHPLTTTSY